MRPNLQSAEIDGNLGNFPGKTPEKMGWLLAGWLGVPDRNPDGAGRARQIVMHGTSTHNSDLVMGVPHQMVKGPVLCGREAKLQLELCIT